MCECLLEVGGFGERDGASTRNRLDESSPPLPLITDVLPLLLLPGEIFVTFLEAQGHGGRAIAKTA